ncbi:hypothetical protein AAP_03316 [Ascosphaera apis ARSEF 7405]|uniref:DDE Tnp4 domain-containing protein n=1 Tax=Ascosphaera apis ARSEF 7405 TaxID=392613 RepID=A0A166NQ43_9EURO|nr:hypothetical protein AAP_03316 [Ascosphaera apis ARSEF 7405]
MSKAEIRAILPYMRLRYKRYKYRNRPSQELTFCIFLARLSYSTRLQDLPYYFGVSQFYITGVFNDVLNHFGSLFKEFLRWDHSRLTFSTMRRYADAIGEGCVWGFIDGTTQKIARPKVDQRSYYSGHKRYHCYKYQAVVTPDGLVSSLAGPMEGIRGDWALFHYSLIADDITEEFRASNVAPEDQVCLFGDPAYAMTGLTMSSYRRPPGGQLEPEYAQWNHHMSTKRIAVEHFFSTVKNRWGLMSLHTINRVGSTAVGNLYAAACFLNNCLTCLRGYNQISLQFQCQPPSLEEYLALIDRVDSPADWR